MWMLFPNVLPARTQEGFVELVQMQSAVHGIGVWYVNDELRIGVLQ
jgi:hypothetical protein